ncbi:hypothetical protein N0A02_33780 (plasmid) [Paraburkholderia acidicola]|uniref:Uncharacterized protein n=1 Tax=Paraburkholderia acidicola TaxID=1912599 RepID=A0ABV1LYR3_9BURK
MDYYQGIVTEYLRADRAMFVNTECCIQLNPGANPDRSGPHWYCDAVAINLRDRQVFLCEISFSSSLSDLGKRLNAWHSNWQALRLALARDLYIDPSWPVTPWAFVPQELFPTLGRRLASTYASEATLTEQMSYPKVTALEEVVPWKYRSWNRTPAPE